MKINNKGFSFVEIIIATALLGALSYGVMHVMKTMTKGQVTTETKMEEIELRRLIATNMLDEVACAETFSGKNIGDVITQIKNNSGTVMYQSNNVYGNHSLKILSMQTEDRGEVFSDGTRMINLNISFQKMKQMALGNNQKATIQVRVKAAGPAAAITACFADKEAIVQQTCLSFGGTWTGMSCELPQYVLKIGDTMTGGLIAPLFTGAFLGNLTGDVVGNVTGNLLGNVTGNITGTTGSFSGNVTAAKFCTGPYCKSMTELALADQACPGGQVQIGVRNDGSVDCKALQCPANQYFAGLNGAGSAICRPYPTNTCPSNQYVSEVNADGTVTCAILPNNANSICPAGEVLQSIIAGVPTCVVKGPTGSCAPGSWVTGFTAAGGVICSTPPQPTSLCPAGFVLQSITAGVPTCVVKASTGTCPPGEMVSGFNASGNILCSPLPAAGPQIDCNWAGVKSNRVNMDGASYRSNTVCFHMTCSGGKVTSINMGTKGGGYDCGD